MENGSRMQRCCIRWLIDTGHTTEVLVELDSVDIWSPGQSLIPERIPSTLPPDIRTSRIDWELCHQCTSSNSYTAVAETQLSSLSGEYRAHTWTFYGRWRPRRGYGGERVQHRCRLATLPCCTAHNCLTAQGHIKCQTTYSEDRVVADT